MTVRPHILLAAVAGIALGYGLARAPQWLAAPRAVPAGVAVATAKPVASHQLLDEVVGRIRREYVRPVPDQAFDQAAVKGVVANLDPHSAFLDAAEYDEMRAATTGSYVRLSGETSPSPVIGGCTLTTYSARESRSAVRSIASWNSGSFTVSVSSWIRTDSVFGLSPES